MMSVKWKLLLILIVSMLVAAGAGIYITQHQTSIPIVDAIDSQQQQLSAVQHSEDVVEYPERSHYQTIPLETISSALQGSNPTTLALSALEDVASTKGKPKIEVVYPQTNQALVTITQIQPHGDSSKYRVEMTTFGRSLLVSSPPVWQIVWAGSQIQCGTRSRPQNKLSQNCQPPEGEIQNSK
jgi:hypothetical protein